MSKIPGRVPVLVLGLLAVVLGASAVWAYERGAALDRTPALRNAALVDNAGTSEVNGQVTTAVNTVFSYNYADTGRTETAASRLLTGRAVQEYDRMFALIRSEAPQQRQILTTTVTDSTVKSIVGSRARLLIYADQRNTRTDKNQTSYSATVFAVDAIRAGGIWKIDDIDLLGS